MYNLRIECEGVSDYKNRDGYDSLFHITEIKYFKREKKTSKKVRVLSTFIYRVWEHI